MLPRVWRTPESSWRQQKSKSENHADAVKVLQAAGGDNATLSRLLGEKTKAGYNVESLTRAKAMKCIEWARKLATAAAEKYVPL